LVERFARCFSDRRAAEQVEIAMASACPHQNEFAVAHSRLTPAAR
jgi:hypothetical protein